MRIGHYTVIADSEIPPGAVRCNMCGGFQVLVQASLDKLPIEHATSANVIRCPVCSGWGFRVVMMEVIQHARDE